jgi:hypothetical protein
MLRALFLHNFWLKLFSLVMAGMVWLAIQGSLRSTAGGVDGAVRHLPSRKFPGQRVMVLTPLGAHPTFAIEPATVSITVRGSLTLLDELRTNDVQAFVRPGPEAPAYGVFPVSVHVPAGVVIERVSPATVALHAAQENR